MIYSIMDELPGINLYYLDDALRGFCSTTMTVKFCWLADMSQDLKLKIACGDTDREQCTLMFLGFFWRQEINSA